MDGPALRLDAYRAVLVVVRAAACWMAVDALAWLASAMVTFGAEWGIADVLPPLIVAAIVWFAAPAVGGLVTWRINGAIDGFSGEDLCVVLVFWIGVERVLGGAIEAFRFDTHQWEQSATGLGGIVDIALGCALILARWTLARWVLTPVGPRRGGAGS